ncbi:MAG: CoA transferase [Chloroflexi bacterium]|nr:CoA transferase [Chloroflexota bacterium]
MALPLEGIRVLDLSSMLAGPGTGMYLADHGADVIKIEPLEGEQNRHGAARNRSFYVLNRGKRSIAVNLAQPEGREILYRLVDGADVLIHNLRPDGAAERLGIDYPTLSARNPRLVYANISAYGNKGRYAPKPGYDRILQGLSGLMAVNRYPNGMPVQAPTWIADCSMPMLLGFGIMLALWQREKTGRGQQVETSLLMASVAMQSTTMVRGKGEPSYGAEMFATYHTYLCADGEWLNICILNDKEWVRLCDVLELPHLAHDPLYDTVAKRADRNAELHPVIEAVFASRGRDEWLDALLDASVPAGPIITRDEAFDEPQIMINEMVAEVDQPGIGTLQMMAVPLRLSETSGRIKGPAPALGQHTLEILGEAGYSAKESERLVGAGITKAPAAALA